MKKKKIDPRPVFLNLLRIRQPITAIVSIGHRISGVFLFLSLPLLIWLLELSLSGPEAYARAGELLTMPWVKLVALVIVWSICHHLLAGIRFLLLDIDIGIDLPKARLSSWLVGAGGIAALLLVATVIL